MSTTELTDDLRTEFHGHERSRPTRPVNRTTRVAWVAAGGLLAVAALFWGTISVIGLVAHGEYTEEFAFSADEVRALDVSSDDGSVTVVAESVDSVTVSAEVSDGLFSTDIDVEIVSGVLEIRGGCPVVASLWCSTDFTVTVPADRPVTIDASNGRVLVREMSARIDVDNDNGTIELDGVVGNVRATSDNGRIEGRRLSSDIVAASTSNGRVELVFADPPDTVTGKTDNGSIDVAVPDDEVLYRVDMRTSNGSTDNAVRTDPASEHLIELTNDNGSITVRPTG